MPKYKVNEPLKHDGVHYGPDAEAGDEVSMSAKAAATLIERGVLSEAKPETAAEKKAREKAEAEAADAAQKAADEEAARLAKESAGK